MQRTEGVPLSTEQATSAVPARPSRSARVRRPTRRTLVWAVALIVWFVVGAVWAFLPPAGAVVGEHWGALAIFAMLAGLFALAEIFVVHVQFRRDAHSFSLLEVPLVVGLVFAPPGTVVLAVVVAGAVVLALHRRQSVIKLCFNVGVYALEVTLALLLFSALAGEASSIGLRVVVAAALAALCESAVGILLVFIAISISEASLRLGELARSLQFGLLTSGFATGLGLTAAILLEDKPAMVWLMLIPTAGIHLASWAYASERRRHEDLEFLYESTRLLHQSPELDAAVSALLHQARDAFRCDIAEVLLLGAAGEHLERAVVGPADQVELFAPIPADPFSRSWLARAHSGPWIATTDDSDEALPYLGQRGFHDAIAAPLTRDGRVTGVLTLANRQSEVTGFHNEDLRVAGTLANHISVALENGRLEVSLEQLRVLERRMHHQAHHDALTGLANRSLFHDLVTDALAEHGGDHVAALFIDLDDFKTVNDTLGHAAGDELLVAVSRRL